MILAVAISGFLIVAIAIAHTVVALIFAQVGDKRLGQLQSQSDRRLAARHNWRPNVGIILTVRGFDPGLEKTVNNLLAQDYDRFRVYIVVDNKSDSAWTRIEEIKATADAHDRLVLIELKPVHQTCSLKCNALIQAVDQLDDSIEVVALIDADVVPHATWVSDIVWPLADESVGFVSGNQWFEPADGGAGSIVRSIWNAGSLVATALLANPWAGTCAMRLSDLHAAGLVDIWKNSIVDDGPIRRALKPLGKKTRFLPEMILINREECSLSFAVSYITRMLTWSRMYEKNFFTTALHVSVYVGMLLIATLSTLFGLLFGNWFVFWFGVILLLIHNAISFYAYQLVRETVGQIAGYRKTTIPRMGIVSSLKIFFLLPLAQFIYGWATIRAAISRKVCWREVTYEINWRNEVTMLPYQPISSQSNVGAQSEVSL